MHSDKVRVRLLEAVWGWDGGQVGWVGIVVRFGGLGDGVVVS